MKRFPFEQHHNDIISELAWVTQLSKKRHSVFRVYVMVWFELMYAICISCCKARMQNILSSGSEVSILILFRVANRVDLRLGWYAYEE